MKISAINTYSYYKNHRLQNTSQYLMSAPATCLHSDSVSFTGKTKNKSSYFVYDMRELEGLTCACCGIKMLKASDANKFLNNKVYYPVYEGLNKMVENGLINPNRENEPMQKAFSFMYKISRENKQMTLNEFYTNDYVKHQRKKLTAAENKALDELREKIKLVAHSSGYLITELTKLNPPFQELEQKVYKELYTLAKMRPDEDFNTILNKPEVKKIVICDNAMKFYMMCPYMLSNFGFPEEFLDNNEFDFLLGIYIDSDTHHGVLTNDVNMIKQHCTIILMGDEYSDKQTIAEIGRRSDVGLLYHSETINDIVTAFQKTIKSENTSRGLYFQLLNQIIQKGVELNETDINRLLTLYNNYNNY